MRPRIRHTHSTDGTTLAYWTLGEGRPLVYLAGAPWAHVELFSVPVCRDWYRRLAAARRVVRYDERGTGRSERDVADFSLDAHGSDLEAVVETLGLEHFDLFAAASAGPVAVDYVARNPQKVGRLVLWCAWARTRDLHSPRLNAWRTLIDQDWMLMTETCAHLALGWSGGDVGRLSAANLRASISTVTARAAMAGSGAHDATESLALVKCPTLVLQRRNISWMPVALSRRLADALPNAELIVLEGESTAPYLGDTDVPLEAIEAFLAGEARYAHRRTNERGNTPAPSARLTSRESQVLRLLAEGQSNREIGTALDVSVRTIDRHVENLYAKLGARGRVDAVTWALERGLT